MGVFNEQSFDHPFAKGIQGEAKFSGPKQRQCPYDPHLSTFAEGRVCFLKFMKIPSFKTFNVFEVTNERHDKKKRKKEP